MSNQHPSFFPGYEAISFPTEAVGYDPSTAWWMAQCSWLTYDCKPFIARTLNRVGFSEIYFFDFRSTQGYLAIHPGNGRKFAVLAFRGTEKDYLDILTDIIIFKTKLPDLEDKAYGEGPLFAHGGFFQAFRSVWGTALPDSIKPEFGAQWIGTEGVSNIIARQLKSETTPLFVTGHSLGGALATLAAYHTCSFHSNTFLYTFGSPRVVNTELAANIDSTLKGRAFRCVNGIDIVPRVPPLFNYHHIDELVYFDPKRGRVNAAKEPNDFYVLLLLHLDALLFFLTFKRRKPKTTLAHTITGYIEGIRSELPVASPAIR